MDEIDIILGTEGKTALSSYNANQPTALEAFSEHFELDIRKGLAELATISTATLPDFALEISKIRSLLQPHFTIKEFPVIQAQLETERQAFADFVVWAEAEKNRFREDWKFVGPILIEAYENEKRQRKSYKGILKRFKAYFAGRHLIFPESFEAFWAWHVLRSRSQSKSGNQYLDISEHDIEDYCEFLTEQHRQKRLVLEGKVITTLLEVFQPKISDKPESIRKPSFNAEYIPTILDLLKVFFSLEDHTQLQTLIETGNDVPEKLTFLNNGNRLADAFKQLFEGEIVTACMKIELEGWIFRNFKYRNQGEIKEFTAPYLNTLVSTNTRPCKNPIFKVISDSNGKQIIKKR